jgi:hypothetical protein
MQSDALWRGSRQFDYPCRCISRWIYSSLRHYDKGGHKRVTVFSLSYGGCYKYPCLPRGPVHMQKPWHSELITLYFIFLILQHVVDIRFIFQWGCLWNTSPFIFGCTTWSAFSQFRSYVTECTTKEHGSGNLWRQEFILFCMLRNLLCSNQLWSFTRLPYSE